MTCTFFKMWIPKKLHSCVFPNLPLLEAVWSLICEEKMRKNLFTQIHLSHKANFFKLAEVVGNEIAKGTAKQKRAEPGGPHLSLSLKLGCFHLETIKQYKNHLLVLRAKILALPVEHVLCLMKRWRHSTAYWSSQNTLLSWGAGLFLLCVWECNSQMNAFFFKYSDMRVDVFCCIGN